MATRWVAPYASDPRRSRGRRLAEPLSPTRGDYERDRDRIVHATAFRRLADKTQVFVAPDGAHYRTRLTHSIEVAQIARAIARALELDEDLAEAVALAHDLGHTPFGHTGEDALDALMRPWGGFDHNAQALRVVTRLERRYAAFDGLNLTWETLEGLVKHNGPLQSADGHPTARYAARGIPAAILAFDADWPLELATYPSAEAQVAALADDIAYNAHDIDDGLRAGLFDLDDLHGIAFVAAIRDEVDATHPGLERVRVIHEIGRRLITRFVEDAITESRRRITALAPRDVTAIRAAGAPVIAFSPDVAEGDRAIKAFLMEAMYRHPDVMAVRRRASDVVETLFARLTADPAALPDEWAARAAALVGERDATARTARLVCDYIAGMTDRYAMAEHDRIIR